MSLLLFLWSAMAAWAGTLRVEVLDIGQGDSILLRSPAGKVVLVDAGDGKVSVPDLLRARGVDHIDLIIATHAHADHIGGMDEVLEAVPVKLYVDQDMTHTTATYSKVMKLVEGKGITYKAGVAGVTFNLDDGIRIELLNPQQKKLSNTRSDLNANSVVARVTHGENCFYLSGDSEADTEELMLQKGLQPCAVYKVAHHGSQYSSTAPFLAALKPTIALVSAGEGNHYGHPTPEALERLKAVGATVYRTDEDGTITVESSGKGVVVTTERGDRGSKPVAPPAHLPLAEAPSKFKVDKAAPHIMVARLNINLATTTEIEELPGIGPTKAAAIVTYRGQHGPFTSVDQLDAVPGIGPSTLASIRELVETDSGPQRPRETH